MNASDYLKQRGWRGLGYSLDKHDRGLARPLLTSRKEDNLGVGLKKAVAGAVSDEWWLKALDEGLKDMGKGEKPKVIPLTGPQRARVVYGSREGLYGCFVKGERLAGSVEEEVKENTMVDGLSGDMTATISASQIVEVSTTARITAAAATTNGAKSPYYSLASSSSSSSSSSESADVISSSVSYPVPESTNATSQTLKRKRKQNKDSLPDASRKRKRFEHKANKEDVKQRTTNQTEEQVVKQMKEVKNKNKSKKANRIEKSSSKNEEFNNDSGEVVSATVDVPATTPYDEPQANHVHADRLALINGTSKNTPTLSNSFSNQRQIGDVQRRPWNKAKGKAQRRGFNQSTESIQPASHANGSTINGTGRNIKRNGKDYSAVNKDNEERKEKGSEKAMKKKDEKNKNVESSRTEITNDTAGKAQRSETKSAEVNTTNGFANVEPEARNTNKFKSKSAQRKRVESALTGKSSNPTLVTTSNVKHENADVRKSNGKAKLKKKASTMLIDDESKRGNRECSHTSHKLMSEKKVRTYTARAKLKGMSLDEYMNRRTVKKKKLAKKS